MGGHDELVEELADLCGISAEYFDIFGKRQVISVEAKKAVLRAMHIAVDSEAVLREEMERRRNYPWREFIEPVKVMSVNDQPLRLSVYVPMDGAEGATGTIYWSVEDEQKKREDFVIAQGDLSFAGERLLDGIRYVRIELKDPSLRDIGYYTVRVRCEVSWPGFPGGSSVMEKESLIVVTPDACFLPPSLKEGKVWGLSVNLYALRSARNWGIGDLGDLREMVAWIAGLGGGFVGINPLHAIPNSSPYGTSPYSPVSRLYKNFVYLDMEGIPDVNESEAARELLASGEFKQRLDEARGGGDVDYGGIASLKEEVLRAAFASFVEKHYRRETDRGSAFRLYRETEGGPLESFAIFFVLWKEMRARFGVYSWQEWPEEFRDPAGESVSRFSREKEDDVLFHQYLQWLIETQHREAGAEAMDKGMTVGLYHDLAIGSVGGGSDAWSYQDTLAAGADVGAPPDDFNLNGQNWGFPPMIPDRLRETRYDLFIKTIRKNMKHGGALRIDHALGLFRLFWIPHGMTAREGAYVAYPAEDLLRIIALESVRNRTVVIAEDLGTIGENVRETLKRFQMLSYRLFYYERKYPEPFFMTPAEYPELALCAVTTHDLPTLSGYWVGRDLQVKQELGMIQDEDLLRQLWEERKRDKGLILAALGEEGILPEGHPLDPNGVPEMTEELCRAIYRYLGLSRSKMVLVSLDDVIGTMDQQNMPGTVDTHPNWKQKTPLALEELVVDKRMAALGEMFREVIPREG